jgi:hypothetical protein
MQTVINKIKKEIELAIRTFSVNGKKQKNGQEAKLSLIRSQRLIHIVHEYVKEQLIQANINKNKIYPARGLTKPEIKITGLLKKKDQDICVSPKILSKEEIKKIRSKKVEDANEVLGTKTFEKTLVINVRSQLSSLEKNVDTLFERTFAEAFNLHARYPKMCIGEVYLIPATEYDEKLAEENKIGFKKNTNIEKYIKLFASINGRKNVDADDYKYERVCLMIVDFKARRPKIYSSISALINDKLVDKKTKLSLDNLTADNFIKDLLRIYNKRFNLRELQ